MMFSRRRGVTVKTAEEIEKMRRAGRIVALVLEELGLMCEPGLPTSEFDRRAAEIAETNGARMAFLGYRGFPANVCVSINEEVVHGIPGPRRLREGDIVSIDVGVELEGYFGDAAATFPVGHVSSEAARIMETTRQALQIAIRHVKPGVRLSQLAAAIQAFAESNGYSVVKDYVGHGIGRSLHEEPRVPNYVDNSLLRADLVFVPGITIAIEPMLTAGTDRVVRLADGWTVVTADRRLSAHFEHTVAVTEADPAVLTAP